MILYVYLYTHFLVGYLNKKETPASLTSHLEVLECFPRPSCARRRTPAGVVNNRLCGRRRRNPSPGVVPRHPGPPPYMGSFFR